MVASMAAVILCSGDIREAYPHCEILIHQPLGTASGQASDILIAAQHIERNRKILYELLAQHTGKSIAEIAKACERDTVFDAEGAKRFGILDKIIR